MRCCGIHLIAISQKILKIFIVEKSLKFTSLRLVKSPRGQWVNSRWMMHSHLIVVCSNVTYNSICLYVADDFIAPFVKHSSWYQYFVWLWSVKHINIPLFFSTCYVPHGPGFPSCIASNPTIAPMWVRLAMMGSPPLLPLSVTPVYYRLHMLHVYFPLDNNNTEKYVFHGIYS